MNRFISGRDPGSGGTGEYIAQLGSKVVFFEFDGIDSCGWGKSPGRGEMI